MIGPDEDAMAKKLLTHMKPMCSNYGFCSVWHPGSLSAGTDEAAAIVARLDTADIAVLLVGPSTPFDLQENLADRKIAVIPVITREVDLSIGPLAGKVSLPRINRTGVQRTLASSRSIDEVMVEIVTEVRGYAERYKEGAKQRGIMVRPPSFTTHDIYDAAICLGLANKRGALLAGIPEAIIAQLETGDSPGAQLSIDIHSLRDDYPAYWPMWLKNAKSQSMMRTEARVFDQALQSI